MSIVLRLILFISIILFSSEMTLAQCFEPCYLYKTYENDTAQVSKLTAEKKWEIDNINLLQHVLIDDVLHDDGIPEIIISGPQGQGLGYPRELFSDELYIINTQTQTVEKIIKTALMGLSDVGNYIVADIDNDCKKEIIIFASSYAYKESTNPDSIRGRLICYNMEGDIIWISDERVSEDIRPTSSSLFLADFNHDGIPELVAGNAIFNARTGVKLCDGGENGMGWALLDSKFSLAANMDDDEALELVAGYTVYKVNITNPDGMEGNSMRPINMLFNGRGYDGSVAVADINGDGRLDVIVTKHFGEFYYDSAEEIVKYLGIYCYTIEGDTARFIARTDMIEGESEFILSPSLTVGKLTPSSNLSIIGLSYIDRPNISFKLRSFVYDGTEILKEEWALPVDENSKISGMTMFDLNNDGMMELIYRDQSKLMIINIIGGEPVIVYQAPCYSITGYEKPVVADIDGSGEARICTTCANTVYEINGQLTIFGPPEGQRWAPARKIVHQYTYNPLFINDDGTVPQYMENPATYKDGRYNNFNVQASLIDEDGNYPAPAASLTGAITCIDYDENSDSYTVYYTVHNRSDASAAAIQGTAVSFYSGNPDTGGMRIGTTYTDVILAAGETSVVYTYQIPSGDIELLYMVVNTDRYPMVLSDTSYYGIDECDYTDNVYIIPMPELLLSETEICEGDTYQYYGRELTEAGKYYHHIRKESGCDSIIYGLTLAVTSQKISEEKNEACDSYDWNGQHLTMEGRYTYETQSMTGCDSIATLDLTIYRSAETKTSLTSCGPINYDGEELKASGEYVFRLQTQAGCDSIVSVNFLIATEQVTTKVGNCDSYEWEEDGATYERSGIYTNTYTNKYGCDSTRVLDLTINPTYDIIKEAEGCGIYKWADFGEEYQQSGDYIRAMTTKAGCDSIVTLRLTINPVTELHDTVVSNVSYYWEINDYTYEESGLYHEDYVSANNCDSIHYLHLLIKQDVDIYFPNIISGLGGANGYFTGYSTTKGLKIKKMQVYDRWGNLMYEGRNIAVNAPESGWDGKYSGRAVTEGVYVWVVEIELPDGTIEVRSGDVTVLR